MEQLQQFVARLKTMFDSASPSQRIMAVGFPAVLAIGLFAAFQSSSPQWVSLPGITRDTILKTQKQLRTAGLSDFQIQNDRILVPATELNRYQQVLGQNDRATTSEWEQQFARTGLFTTREQLQAARDIALEKTIRRAILAVPAIDDVSVTWARSQQRRWGAQPATVTATVCVTPNAQHRITPQLSRSLQTAVANMIPDLQPGNVTVFDQSTGQSTGNFGIANDVEVARRAMEDNYRQRLQSALGFLPNAMVTVAATGESPDHQLQHSNEQPINPVATANHTITNGSTRPNRMDLHVSVYVTDPVYQALGKPSGLKTRREIESVVRRIVEPREVLASLHLGSQSNVVSGKSPKSRTAETDRTTAWVTPLICLAVWGIPLWWSRRLKTKTEHTLTETTEVIEPEGEISGDVAIAADDATEDTQPVADLESVLTTHPNESLAVLQNWAQTSEQSAATIASQMEPSIASQFAARMSDDERNRLHEALQTDLSESIADKSLAVNSFCRQVADAALKPQPTSVQRKPASLPATRRQSTQSIVDSTSKKPGSRIYEFPPRLVAQLLENEQPQTIAIAIAQLDAKSIDKILRNFAKARSTRIRERLLTVDAVPSGLRSEIEDVVLQQLLKTSTTETQ